MALYDGRMYDFPQNDAATSSFCRHSLPNDPTDGRDNYCLEGQQSSSQNTSSPVGATFGAHPADNQTPQCDESTRLIVDVVGFNVGKDFFIKELAFYNPTTDMAWQGLFKPPFEKELFKKKGLNCLDSNTQLHGLRWDAGDYPYSALYPTIAFFAQSGTLYASGEERCQQIQQFSTATIMNLEAMGCPPAKWLPHECLCPNHNTYNSECALDRAVRLGRHISQMYNMVPPKQAPPETIP